MKPMVIATPENVCFENRYNAEENVFKEYLLNFIQKIKHLSPATDRFCC